MKFLFYVNKKNCFSSDLKRPKNNEILGDHMEQITVAHLPAPNAKIGSSRFSIRKKEEFASLNFDPSLERNPEIGKSLKQFVRRVYSY